MKTSTLTGADLNRAVAMSLGLRVSLDGKSYWEVVEGYGLDDFPLPNYAGNITAAWPIIKEYKIDLNFDANGILEGCEACMYRYGGQGAYVEAHDDDPITAAMRCFVASVYGDEIDLEGV